METDSHHFRVGVFVVGISIAAAFFAAWLGAFSHRDDVVYRIRFAESVSGLAVGDAVKFRGVDVGTVKAMTIDPADPQGVQVDVSLRKDTPVKTDTRAVLKLKGFTGVVFIDLTGGGADATRLVAVTPEGQIPEIASEKSNLTTVIEQLPEVIGRLAKVIGKFSAIEDQGKKVLSDVSGLTARLKENPSLLIFPPKEKEKERVGALRK
jgi:phospholipid/cholesterol/gamma-HCH transport system substrate-binding protein